MKTARIFSVSLPVVIKKDACGIMAKKLCGVILHVYHQQENQGLKLLVRLKEHVCLNPYSAMATQALSDTVATAGFVG